MERTPSTARAVAQFALAGLVVLALFLVGSVLVFRSFGRSEALRDARQFAVLTGQGIVEPALQTGVLAGDEHALTQLDQIVQERVLGDRIARVKVWTVGGRIVYSDEPRLIGQTFPLDAEKLEVLRTGDARAEVSSLEGAENRFERGLGDVYEVYLPIRAPDGTPLVFETYQRASTVASTGRRIWIPFAALLLVSLFLLWLVQVPLAWRLARSLRRSQEDREQLLERALEASDDERRRIAADLHDGVVQDLAGISYSLSAAAEQADERPAAETRSAVREAAAATRGVMRRLRSVLVEIHPPNLRASGLAAALEDVVAPLAADGVEAIARRRRRAVARGRGAALLPRSGRGDPQRSPARRGVDRGRQCLVLERRCPPGGRGRRRRLHIRPSASAVAPKGTSASRCSKSWRPVWVGA